MSVWAMSIDPEVGDAEASRTGTFRVMSESGGLWKRSAASTAVLCPAVQEEVSKWL